MLLWVNLVLLVSVCALFLMVQVASNAAEEALRGRGARIDIAHEFGRTSDQMTRVARAYAVTGEAGYQGYYNDILAIRDGRKARPLPYERTYWNMVIAGRPQNGRGRAVPIMTLAREAGYSDAHLALLGASRDASDALVALERAALREGGSAGQALLFADRHSLAKAAVMAPLDELLHLVEAESDRAIRSAQRRASTLGTLLIGALCLSAAAIAFAAWRFVSRVVQPICRLSSVMTEIARGDDEAIPFTDRRDEIGRMARAVEAFRAAMEERDRMHLAEHLLTKRREDEAAAHAQALRDAAAQIERAGAVETLVHGFTDALQTAMSGVQEASGELNECAQTMTLVADSTERRVAEIEEGGRDTAAHVDTVAATCRQLARATGEIALQTDRSIASADRAVEAVRRTDATVDQLIAQSENIQGIVTLIGSIATKTNRLAINATIEAAHAGAAGRGFAIVAAEVKSLALQTACAANDISDQLGAVRTGSRETAAMIDVIATSIAEAREISLAIGSAVEQQASATSEISRNADRAAARTRQSATSMATIRDGSSHTHAAVARMIGAASALAGTGEAVNRAVERCVGLVVGQFEKSAPNR